VSLLLSDLFIFTTTYSHTRVAGWLITFMHTGSMALPIR